MPRKPGGSDPSDRDRLVHMLEAARHATGFVAGRSRRDLDSDPMLRRALVNAIQEIGEAAANLSQPARSRVADVPWPLVVRMRNIMVHVYWGISHDRLWTTATQDLAPLIAALQAALAGWPPEPPPSPQPPISQG